METFTDRLQKAMRVKESVLCVGFDPQLKFIPPHLIKEAIKFKGRTWEALEYCFLKFNLGIMDAVEPYAAVIKPQAAFYEASYQLWHALEQTINWAEKCELLVIKDAKRLDGGDTADAYAQTHIGMVPFFDGKMIKSPLRTDAVTIGGSIGEDCISRFVKEMKAHGTGGFVVDKTSFKPNSVIEQLVTENGLSVWEELAYYVSMWGEGTEGENGYRNLGVVMGATYPEDALRMRKILPNAVMLVPGYSLPDSIGQGGTADEAVVSFNDDGFGAVVNASRAIIAAWQKGPFACDPKDFAKAAGQAAKAARDDLNEALKRAGKYPF